MGFNSGFKGLIVILTFLWVHHYITVDNKEIKRDSVLKSVIYSCYT